MCRFLGGLCDFDILDNSQYSELGQCSEIAVAPRWSTGTRNCADQAAIDKLGAEATRKVPRSKLLRLVREVVETRADHLTKYRVEE